jgi:hypothetical protein
MRSNKAAGSDCDLAHLSGSGPWIDQEMEGCCFQDVRLAKRFGKLLEMISGGMGESIPAACQDWANTKAAYRFFTNERVSEAEILAGHFQATAGRISAAEGSILILHDTTEFTYERASHFKLGLICRPAMGRTKGRLRHHTVRGILMHSSLAVTTEGLPLGLAAVKFWTRKRFKGCNALKRKINPTRVPIEKKESIRWLENLRQATALANRPQDCVHIGDRESDIYELFCAAQEVGTRFLVRTCVDRLAEDGTGTVADQMKKAPVRGTHRIEARDASGKPFEAFLEIQFKRLQVLPPIGKQARYPELSLTVIHARERPTPSKREPIEWKLITNLPVNSLAAAIEKLEWYAMRWKIETFHKILKSGCKAEESKLRTSARLVNLLALFCVIGWRIFWMTMIQRAAPNAPPAAVLTETELIVLDRLFHGDNSVQPIDATVVGYLTKVARLGGYLARASDPPPGNMVMWRGLSRLTDIQLGFALGAQFCG